MDTRRKSILWVCALLIVATCLYPPWVVGLNQVNVGYDWLSFAPVGARIDLSRLAVAWVIIGVVGAALFWAWPGVAIRRIWSSPSLRSWTASVAIFVAVVVAVLVLLAGLINNDEVDGLAKRIPQLRDPAWWWTVAIAVGLFVSWKNRRKA